MAFVTPQYAGPQRKLDWADRYAGTVGQLNAGRYSAGNQNLAMANLAFAGKEADSGRREAAFQTLLGSLQGAHQLQFQKDQLAQQRSADRASLGLGIAQTGISGFSAANSAFGAGGIFEGSFTSQGVGGVSNGFQMPGSDQFSFATQAKTAPQFTTPNVMAQTVVPRR